MCRKKKGRSLETLVTAVERALAGASNVTVQSPKHLPDRITRKLREHDVVITLSGSHHKSVIAIECRDRSRKITVNDIEGFWSKCQDTDVDQGIVVSPKGFTKAAITKAANKGIRTLRLSQATSFNWLLAAGLRSTGTESCYTPIGPFIRLRCLIQNLFRSQSLLPKGKSYRRRTFRLLHIKSLSAYQRRILSLAEESRRSCSSRMDCFSEMTQQV